MSDSLDEAMVELQRGYLAEFPDRLEELRDDIAAFRALRPEAAASLKSHFHRLAGSGGSYGFPEISLVAREMEQWMAAKPAPGEAPRLDAAVDRLATLFRQAQARMGTPARPAGTRLRATVILPASANPERIADAIEAEGYDVRLGHRLEDPSETPPGERPDLLIIGTAAGEGDPSAIASAWTGRAIRPRAVVLIETLRAVDRLRAIAAGEDAVIAVERMPEDQPRSAPSWSWSTIPSARRRRLASWKRPTSGSCVARSPRLCRSSSIARCPTSCCWRRACPTATGRPWPASSARIRASA